MATELEIYKSALKEIGRKVGQGHPLKEYMRGGFCAYFGHKIGAWDFREKCPTLWSLRPEGAEIDRYWFEKGDWSPRIRLLVKAVKKLKNGYEVREEHH